MSFLQILYQTLFYPLELLFELVYSLEMRFISSSGICIVLLSLFLNLLLFPVYELLYNIERQQKKKEKLLSDWTSHIRKTFRGDERFFMLKTYYRQNQYHPIEALKGAFPLMLEIPFFIAAYHFLSHLSQLNGIPFLAIRDLGEPDQLISWGNIRINIMPIVMTLVNLVSVLIYSKEMTVKKKLRLFGMALLFLVLLYRSPSGLVLYWTCNNLFALGKNIFFLLRDKRGLQCGTEQIDKKHEKKKQYSGRGEENTTFGFITCEIVNILLLGIVIPTGVIKSSPLEFVDITALRNPLEFLKGSVSLAIGYFGIWLPFFYYIAKKGREKIYLYLCVYSLLAMVDYFYFGTEMGFISGDLQYTNGMDFSVKEMIINTFLVVGISLFCIALLRYRRKMLYMIHVISVIALIVMSFSNMVSIASDYGNSNFQESDGEKITIPLSQNGKNVVIFMLDRAISGYIPYIMNEKPELKEQFSGFTYYPNTVSFGLQTEQASAAVFGGYEYTKIDTTEQRNEALKLLPQLFSENGYRVTVFDAPLANGQVVPDLSIYDNMQVRAFHVNNRFHYSYQGLDRVERRYRNFFCYSFCKSVPLIFQYTLYDGGYYNDVTIYVTDTVYMQVAKKEDISKGYGYSQVFLQEYAELCKLSELTEITSDEKDNFFMGYNGTPHEPVILTEPEYLPAFYVDNTEYDDAHWDRFIVNGKELTVENAEQMKHYQVNMATMLRLGQWFDYLKEKGVYDNTRIILVADHGYGLMQFDELLDEDGYDFSGLNPLLMVKDFGDSRFQSDDSFMTNADVPMLAMDQIVENPVNPFTGKKVDNEAKYSGKLLVNDMYYVKDNIFVPENWTFITGK